jgi:hypothetical protein
MEEPLLKTGSAERLSDLPGLLDQPAVTGGVEKLYKEIATHHPVGIPKVAEMATIRPYLSKRLTEQLRTAQACQADYFRQHHLTSDGIPKPRWLKTGLFSGDGNHALPDDPTPDRKEQHKDGTFLVYVMLSTRVMRHKNSHKGRFHTLGESWQVAVKAISEDGQFVVDDLRIFDSYDTGGPSHLLSDAFTGCDGPHWTGLTANK